MQRVPGTDALWCAFEYDRSGSSALKRQNIVTGSGGSRLQHSTGKGFIAVDALERARLRMGLLVRLQLGHRHEVFAALETGQQIETGSLSGDGDRVEIVGRDHIGCVGGR